MYVNFLPPVLLLIALKLCSRLSFQDFEGQKLADRMTRYVLISATVSRINLTFIQAACIRLPGCAHVNNSFLQIISFLAGAVTQSLKTSFGIFSIATVILALVRISHSVSSNMTHIFTAQLVRWSDRGSPLAVLQPTSCKMASGAQEVDERPIIMKPQGLL